MTRRPKLSVRVPFLALVCSVALVTAGIAAPAGATGTATADPALEVQGVAGQPFDDATCPRDPEFPEAVNQRQHLVGLVSTHIGPAGLVLDVCRIFVGALGGMPVQGSFTLRTNAGTLRGRALGSVGFSATDDFNLVLKVRRASFLLAKVRGSLTFATSVGVVGPWSPFDGTLTTDLHVGDHPVQL